MCIFTNKAFQQSFNANATVEFHQLVENSEVVIVVVTANVCRFDQLGQDYGY